MIQFSRKDMWSCIIVTGMSLVALGVACGGMSTVRGQELEKTAVPEEPWKPRETPITPAPEPVPALKYRFLPSVAELNRGNAAPIYLRLRHEQGDEGWNLISENTSKWLDLPLSEFPTKEAREFVGSWSRRLKQIEYGTRREHCDWEYTLPEERLNSMEILLPDVQSMRTWARLLSLKARVEIAEGKFDDASGTIETGLAFGRHVAEAPFLINRLVGISICGTMLDRVEELVSAPGAPNVYWALTVLPHPMIDLRPSLEQEQVFGENMVPELLNDLSTEKTDGEWMATRDQMLARLNKIARLSLGAGEVQDETFLQKLTRAWEQASSRAALLPLARSYLGDQLGLKESQVQAMNEDRAIVLYLAGRYREIRDTAFKVGYLPFSDPLITVYEKRVESAVAELKNSPLASLSSMLPAAISTRWAEVRLDQRIAALRAEEAIRMQAATDRGKFPESLSAVTAAPVPPDPATGNPFDYKREGDSAVLVGGRIDGASKPQVGYRLTVRP